MSQAHLSTLEKILDLARWAPSGDNSQIWRFEIVADDHVVVHGRDTRHEVVYDLDGTASQIGLGALLETISIAATRFGFRVDAERRVDSPIEHPLIDVRLRAEPGLAADPLAASIETRTVNRRPLSTRALTPAEREALDAAASPHHHVVWRDGASARRRMASLLFASAKLRLTMPEAYTVHRDAIEWGAQFSTDRVPEQAVGMDPLTAKLMRWVMKSWPRVHFFNRFLAGTWAPRIQLDVLPALFCASHFVLVAKATPRTIDDFIAGGRAMQRFWLTVAHLGLQMQPEVTPMIFARYSREGLRFSAVPGMSEAAARVAERLAREVGRDAVDNGVFMGRVGAGEAARSRSVRLPLAELMVRPT